MGKNNIISWEEIQPDFKDGALILGNGASIAMHRAFEYKNLFEKSKNENPEMKSVELLFEAFKETNFEVIMYQLLAAIFIDNHCNKNNKNIGITQHYNLIRDALLNTIKSIHPKYEKLNNTFSQKNFFDEKVGFLSTFKTIINLNYDLLVYWMILYSNDKTEKENNSTYFKDCFIHGTFDEELEKLRQEPYKKHERVCLLFYPHGNLYLAVNPINKSVLKISGKNCSDSLISVIEQKWIENKMTPLIICEGTPKTKFESIESNSYTSFVYHKVLANLEENIVILGWSISEQDIHILHKILKSRPKKIAISYYNNETDFKELNKRITNAWEEIFVNIPEISKSYPEIYFFKSTEVWSNSTFDQN